MQETLHPKLVHQQGAIDVGIFDLAIVVPCYNENSVIPTLTSLKENPDDQLYALVVIVFNASDDDIEGVVDQNSKAFLETKNWLDKTPIGFACEVLLYEDLPSKLAGVGLARKLGMDRAAVLLKKGEAPIVCLDADCTVSVNYMPEILSYYALHPSIKGANIHFEHKPLHPGIEKYELHLRYFRQALKHASFPYAFHTVGSSMSIRASTYVHSGGMNTRKAGEDFYFLQKIFTQYPFGEIFKATVYPSSRISERVPFGTGMSLKQFQTTQELLSYHPQSFFQLKLLFDQVRASHDKKTWKCIGKEAKFVEGSLAFFNAVDLDKQLEKLWDNYKDANNRNTAFFRWFNNFRVIKYLHHMRQLEFPDMPVESAALVFLSSIKGEISEEPISLLDMFRKLDKLASDNLST